VGGCIVQNKTTYSLESIYQIDVVKNKVKGAVLFREV